MEKILAVAILEMKDDVIVTYSERAYEQGSLLFAWRHGRQVGGFRQPNSGHIALPSYFSGNWIATLCNTSQLKCMAEKTKGFHTVNNSG